MASAQTAVQVEVATAEAPQPSWFGRMMSQRKAAADAKVEREYESSLASISESFEDLDQLQFLQTGTLDKWGKPVVLVFSKNYKNKVLQADRVYRYLIQKLDSLVEDSYSIMWFHTSSTYRENCPSISWLWRTYERLPAKYRNNLTRVYMVHCDMSLWLSLAVLGPLLSTQFWRKIEWVSRVEFLWETVAKKDLALPEFVRDHDNLLEDQPLMDYGVVANRDAMVPGMPAPI